LETWFVVAALVFLVLLLAGADDPSAYVLIALLSGCAGAEITAGVVCVLKGYRAAGWAGIGGWLVLPLGITMSTTLFAESTAPAFFGSVLGAGVVLVLTGLAVTTASRPASYGSWWDRQNWGNRP
jgi:hypothetical protein